MEWGFGSDVGIISTIDLLIVKPLYKTTQSTAPPSK